MADIHNKTDRPIQYRPDTKEMQMNANCGYYEAELNPDDAPGGRGAMPKEQYPVGHVKTKAWNKNRPRRGK